MVRLRSEARKGDAPIRITTAASSRAEDIAHRQKVYLLSMSIRSACFIGAVFAGVNHVNWLWPILIVAALVLPYVAVVNANAARSKGEQFALLDATSDQRQLGPGGAGRAATGETTSETTSETGETMDDEGRLGDICSAKGCDADAAWELQWNNPKIHTPDRRKVWLACDEHRQSLTDFLAARGFLRDTIPH